MTKAVLTNAAHYMNGTGANDALPSNNQGLGLMDLDRSFDSVSRILSDEDGARMFTATGQIQVLTGAVVDATQPLRISLAWTDQPGPTSGAAWVNNLDLTVTVNGSEYKGNVFSGANSVTGGSADPSNNLESVFLPAGLPVGTVVAITVTAANIAGDGVPGNASALDQDFALVGYNLQTGTWVWGLEADFDYSGMKGSDSSGTGVCAGAGCESKLTWFGTGRGRIGFRAGSIHFGASGVEHRQGNGHAQADHLIGARAAAHLSTGQAQRGIGDTCPPGDLHARLCARLLGTGLPQFGQFVEEQRRDTVKCW